MKKNLLIIAAAATILASCAKNDSFREVITQQEDNAIGFATFTTKQVRTKGDAENSSATHADAEAALNTYNTTFRLWGGKYKSTTFTPVFGFEGTQDNVSGYPGETVTYNSPADALLGNWIYNPVRFWDKSATSYTFSAASPAAPKTDVASSEAKSWTISANYPTNKYFTLSDFVVSGNNRATEAAGQTGEGDVTAVKALPNAQKIMASDNTEDLMIATDITSYTDFAYTQGGIHENGVHLEFNHILSRLNIGVRKSYNLNGYTVKLNSITVNNMIKQGSFTENTDLNNDTEFTDADLTVLKTGSDGRWNKGNTPALFADGTMEYANTTGGLPITAIGPAANAQDANTYQYVYEGLVIPQTVGFTKTVLVNDDNKPASYLLIDGSNVNPNSTKSDPYIIINYSIYTTGDTPKLVDSYKYYYNLADVFNGNDATDVKFCEGWQNTLRITLDPTAIKFAPVVYKWAEKGPFNFEVE